MTAKLLGIGIDDGFSLGTAGGIGRYTQLLYDQFATGAATRPILIRKDLLNPLPQKIRRLAYILWANAYLPLFAHKHRLDIVHFTNYFVPIIKPREVAYVVTVPDLAVWQVPDTFPPTYVPYMRRVATAAVQRATLVLTLSQSVQQEICARFNVKRTRVLVVGASSSLLDCSIAAESKQIDRSHQLHLLSVGRIELRKNYPVLLSALLNLCRAGYKCHLTIVGSLGYGYEDVFDFIVRNSLSHAVRISENVPDDELRMLYKAADLFVYPSVYEGFGIPVLEAMAFGLPVVASDIPTNRELLGDTGLFFSPKDSNYLAQLILDLIERPELYSQLSGIGLERASLWSPKHFVERHLQAYYQAVSPQ